MTVAPPATVTRSAVRFRRRAAWLALSAVLLLAVSAASIAIGSAALPLSTVWSAFTAPDGGIDHATILTLRVPRTLLGLLIGASLAVAGALMQGLTRNPLGDPGILGVNAGAGFAIVLGVSVWGVTRISDYLWFGFLGAVVAGAVVYAVAARGPGGATPLRLTLVGVALSAVLMGFSFTLSRC
ncbi:iron chelate uptake ABC transporter family permease subunit [Leucobacter luti]|uniref:iron chelate uptake ABC transporter family permease subunit n=1 Tax=Leucobacter luti TaxID=340320 RepID=UPI00215DBFAF|nr:iron chelate uptake ABC transporter family permease subunit [Leucobacter luti]